MKKADILAAVKDGIFLYHCENNDWIVYHLGKKVKVIDAEIGHWAEVWENGERDYVRRAYASNFYRSRTRHGYLAVQENGEKCVVRAAGLRGTWENCTELVAERDKAKLALAKRRETQRDDQVRYRNELRADFDLYIKDYNALEGTVSVDTVKLLELLRKLSN
jgi:hypothetical protein